MEQFKKYLYILKRIFQKKIKISSLDKLKKNLIILDGESFDDLRIVLSGLELAVIETRYTRLKNVYFSLGLIKNLIFNYFSLKKKFNFSTIYVFSILELINPKVVLTFIDNSEIFSNLAILLEKKIVFLAIQNAARYDFIRNKYLFDKKKIRHNPNKNFYLPHYISLGKIEQEDSKKYNLKIKNIYPLGSLRFANFLHEIKIKNIKLEKNKYDICLISEPAKNDKKIFGMDSIEEGFIKLIEFTIKFSIENKKKFIFIQKKKRGPLKDVEINYYKNCLNKHDFNYLLQNSIEKNDSSSYQTIFESHVAIGRQSTMLREKLGYGEKILSANYSDTSSFEFPISGICKTNDQNYKKFEERLKKILALDIENYFKLINKDKDYVMVFSREESTISKIRKKLDFFLS